MPVRKRGRAWHVDVQIGRRRIRQSAGRGISRAQALELEARIRADAHAGRIGRRQSHSLAEAIERWLNGEALALAHYRDLKSKTRAWLPFVRGLDLIEAGEAADHARTTWLKKGLAPATINRRLALLRRVLRLAWRSWQWLEQPITIELLPGERPRMLQLDPGQARVFLAACRRRKRALHDIVLLGIHTGLRPSELLALEPKHVRGGRPVLLCASRMMRPRSIPLTPEAAAIARRLPLAMRPDEFRFNFRKAAEAAKMPWLQRRDLRRTFGSWIVQRTKSLKAAQDLLGHASPAITARHYAHLLDKHLEAAVGTLPRLGASQRRHSPKGVKR